MKPHYQKCFRKCLFWATRFLLDITCLVPVYPPGCALPWHNPEPAFCIYPCPYGSPGSRAKQNSVSYSHLFKFCSVWFTRAAFSKASTRERSPTKQYLWRHFLLFSRRTFAGARFAERSTGFLFLQIWYNVEHKIFMIQKWMKVKCIYVP